jgi:hypothetical protein
MLVPSDTPQTHFAHVGGALSSEPKRPMVTHPCKHGSSDVLFALAELCTYPTPCSLQNGCVGLIASLLLAILTHRLGMRRLPPVG